MLIQKMLLPAVTSRFRAANKGHEADSIAFATTANNGGRLITDPAAALRAVSTVLLLL